MANDFQRGDTITFKWRPVGGGLAVQPVAAADAVPADVGAALAAQIQAGEVTLGIKSHNIDLECLLHDVSNTKHRGGTARIGGKADSKGTVNASADFSELPWRFGIFPGLSGVIFFGLSALPLVQGIELPCIVGKLHDESSVETEVRWSFDVSMNVLAGTLVMPTGV